MKTIPLRTVPSPAVLVVALLLLLLVLGSLPAAAKDPTFHGSVRDTTTMEPIAGAEVTVYDRDNGTVLNQTTTDETGRYTISIQFHGWVTLTVRAEGYNNYSQEHDVKRGTYDPLDVSQVL